jgi:hypothetical protein
MKLTRGAGGLLILMQLALAPAVLASPGEPTGYTGNWTTIDCATWWEEGPDGHIVDCDRWGDGSSMTLRIGPGETPRIVFQDDYASSCAVASSPSTRWVGAGSGSYADLGLVVTLTKTGCGTFQAGGSVELGLYHDPGSDTLWEDGDGDGWGIIWQRTA